MFMPRPSFLRRASPQGLVLLVLLILLVQGLLTVSGAFGQTRYLAFGDSITGGFGDSVPETDPAAGYPSRLESLLNGASVAKFGVGGKTTTELLNESADEAFSSNPADVLLLMAGTNDVTQRRTGSARSVSEETSIFNLGAIASRAATFGINSTVHATVIPRPSTAANDPQNIDNQSFNQAVRDFAGDRALSLVDNYELWTSRGGGVNSLYYSTLCKGSGSGPEPDCVGHPNPQGYDLMAQTFADVLSGVDSVPPVPGSMFPKKGDQGIDPSPAIVVELWDFGDGIDLSSVVLLVNGVAVGSTVSGSSVNAVVQFQPTTPLSGTVSLGLRATDLASPGNTTDRDFASFEVAGGGTDFDGDVDGNGRVDGFDLLELALSFGADSSQGRYQQEADFNDDAIVDGSDLAVLAANFGRTSS